MMFFDSLASIFLSFGVTLLTVVILYYKWAFQYWKRKNLPYLEPRIPFGTSQNLFKFPDHVSVDMKRKYDEIRGRGWKHAGIYEIVRPTYLVADLEYVKNIMAKDFHHFTDRGFFYNEKDDPLSAHLFFLGGGRWRQLRTKITPTFTSGKMKMMFQTLVDCVPNLLRKIEDDRRNDGGIDIKEVLGCFTTDIIGSCAFGLECNTFKDTSSPFRTYGKKIFVISKTIFFELIFSSFFPEVAKLLGFTGTHRDASAFFFGVVKDTVKYRETNGSTRKDFMQLLIDLKNDGNSLTIEEIAAQCFVFFIAGFETSSTAMTFALYELAKHQDLQDKAREEINQVLKKHGTITYEAIHEMKFLDQVIDESLRMYPPVPFLLRKCVEDYKIPDEDVVIEKGTIAVIPILGIHYDKEFYPNPEKFDPERFTPEKKASRHAYAHLPFGEGPRMCIGMRFGLMQTKVGLVSLLRNYKFSVNEKTQEPIKFKPLSLVLAPEGVILLDVEKI